MAYIDLSISEEEIGEVLADINANNHRNKRNAKVSPIPKSGVKMLNPQDEMQEMKEIIKKKLKKDKEKRENRLDIQEQCTICLDDFECNPQDEETLI
jgi:hypothetical protein